MNNLTKTALSLLAIAAIFFAGYFMKGCNGDDQSTIVDTVRTIEIRHDTVTNTVTEKIRSKPDTIFKTKVDTFRDTAYVYADYYQYKWYSHEYSDTNIKIYTQAGIFQNSLDSIKLNYELVNTTKTVTNTITKTKSYEYKIWLGSSVNFNRVNLSAEFDKGKYKIGLQRNLLSRRELKEYEKWWIKGSFVLFEK